MTADFDLIFLRHSLPLIDPARPAAEWRLSDEGRRRARRLAQRLVEFSPGAIVSSLEPKAIETAQIAAETSGVPWRTAPGLHEHPRTREKYTSQVEFEASLREFFAQPGRLVFGDESADQAYQRFAAAVQSVRQAASGAYPLVIVSHGTVISLYVARRYGLEPYPFWKSLELPCLVVLSAHHPQTVSLESGP